MMRAVLREEDTCFLQDEKGGKKEVFNRMESKSQPYLGATGGLKSYEIL